MPKKKPAKKPAKKVVQKSVKLVNHDDKPLLVYTDGKKAAVLSTNKKNTYRLMPETEVEVPKYVAEAVKKTGKVEFKN